MPDILASVTMHEIKATGITPETWDKWKDVKELLGGDTNSKAMTTLVNLVYLLYCSNRWEDVQRKAATLITSQWADRSLNQIVPMHPSEVKRVTMDAGKVAVYTRSQGEPYLIKREEWEKG